MVTQSINNKNIFMTCHWEDIIISTFEVDKAILEKYLPNNTELDLFNGKALMSIVAFTFSKVKFFEIKIPFHQKFGQINFRFYAKSKIDGTKGVVFIKEFAPKPIIALTANIFYNEPYFTKNIRFNISTKSDEKTIKYAYKDMSVKAKVKTASKPLIKNSLEEFVVDKYVAFVKSNTSKTLQYRIHHKPWKLYEFIHTEINENLISLLPKHFKSAKLIKTYIVDGSFVSVEKGKLPTTISVEKTRTHFA